MPLKKCMEHHRDCIEKSCETLSRLFKYQHVSFICILCYKILPVDYGINEGYRVIIKKG